MRESYLLQGFETLDPFIPIETSLYSMDEAEAAYAYYYDKRWITSDKGECFSVNSDLIFNFRTLN